jgi:hypothetical protein
MKNFFKSIHVFLVILCSFNPVFIQNTFAQSSPFDATYNAQCDSRCQGNQLHSYSCGDVKDQNTCNNNYNIQGTTMGEQGLIAGEPYQCVWGQGGGNSCNSLRVSKDGTGVSCKCNKTYANPSKGVPNVNKKCSGDRVNYQGLCYTPCAGSYTMRSAGICTVKGL